MKRQAPEQLSSDPKRTAVNPPPPKAKASAPSIAALQNQITLAKQAFKDQDQALSDLNIEVRSHENLIWKQHDEITRLRKTPNTAGEDYAKILAGSNGRLHTKVAGLKERNEFLEAELGAARKLYEMIIPEKAEVVPENEALRERVAELEGSEEMREKEIWVMEAQMEGKDRAIREKVGELEALKEELAEKKRQLHRQVLSGV